MDWIVYCLDCQEEIDRMKNGGMAEGYARKHRREHDHKVIIGYEVD